MNCWPKQLRLGNLGYDIAIRFKAITAQLVALQFGGKDWWPSQPNHEAVVSGAYTCSILDFATATAPLAVADSQ